MPEDANPTFIIYDDFGYVEQKDYFYYCLKQVRRGLPKKCIFTYKDLTEEEEKILAEW